MRARKAVVTACIAAALAGVTVTARTEEADAHISEAAYQACEEIGAEYAICPELLMAVIEKESEGDPDAVGKAGEVGLMQVYPKYHAERMDELGVYSLYDERGNILVATDYLAELFEEYGDAALALDVFHGDSDAEYNYEHGIVSDYAGWILDRSAELERVHGK